MQINQYCFDNANAIKYEKKNIWEQFKNPEERY